MKDFDYIKYSFENDGIEAPDILSKGAVMDMLENEEGKQQNAVQFEPVLPVKSSGNKTGRRRRHRYITGIAACLALVLVAVPVARNIYYSAPDTGMAGDELKTFSSEGEIKRLVRNIEHENGYSGFFHMGSGQIMESAEEYSGEDMAASDSGGAYSAQGSVPKNDNNNSYSETYKQVEGVDEADIIKTDGKHIYYVDGYDEVVIYRASDGETEHVATISQFDEDGAIEEMYLDGDRLFTIGSTYQGGAYKSIAISYDVSDPSEPKEAGRFEQSGSILSSRLTGGIVYLVTTDYATSNRYIPRVTIDGTYRNMQPVDICTFPEPSSSEYVVVSSIDFQTGNKVKSRTKAVFGASTDIYCNTDNLYIAGTEYQNGTTVTRIARIALADGKIKFDKTGKVRGYIIGQFAMDEHDGYFRIATTADKSGKDVNNLYVLDGDMQTIGSITGFARNEHIEAVRFIGDRGYVITYEQIDPLFVLDLSDPKQPKIDGEVEITGFSTLLVPVSDNKLVGIGYATGDNDYGGQMSTGTKLALFDISNPSKPEVMDSKEFPGMYSEAQTDHHALLQNRDEDYLAIPYGYTDPQIELIEDIESFGDTDDIIIEDAVEPDDTGTEKEQGTNGSHGGVIIFSADGGINILEDHNVGEDGVRRCIYIGKYIYAVDENDEITGFSFER